MIAVCVARQFIYLPATMYLVIMEFGGNMRNMHKHEYYFIAAFLNMKLHQKRG